MNNPLVFQQMAEDLLAAAVAAYSQPNTPDLPARQFITHGQPLVEGEQLTVVCNGVRPTAPFPLTQLRAPKAVVTPGADFTLEWWRACWPPPNVSAAGSQMPDPAGFTAASALLQQDLATVVMYVIDLGLDGLLLPSQPTLKTAQDVSFGTAVPKGPQGNLAGWGWPLQVKLP